MLNEVRELPTLAPSVTSALASTPSNLVPSDATSRPSTVPDTVMLPVVETLPVANAPTFNEAKASATAAPLPAPSK